MTVVVSKLAFYLLSKNNLIFRCAALKENANKDTEAVARYKLAKRYRHSES